MTPQERKSQIIQVMEEELKLKTCHEDSIPELVKVLTEVAIPPSNGFDYRRVTYIDERTIIAAADKLIALEAVVWYEPEKQLPEFQQSVWCMYQVGDKLKLETYGYSISAREFKVIVRCWTPVIFPDAPR